eukprot:c6973_g1_i1.p1 GENE.c6973_g1_i1~~c6973_g1_i1.p1  ORF type:complete len:171 (-),score=13.02 c6973_g1_i1:713-1198(-)
MTSMINLNLSCERTCIQHTLCGCAICTQHKATFITWRLLSPRFYLIVTSSIFFGHPQLTTRTFPLGQVTSRRQCSQHEKNQKKRRFHATFQQQMQQTIEKPWLSILETPEFKMKNNKSGANKQVVLSSWKGSKPKSFSMTIDLWRLLARISEHNIVFLAVI